MDNLKDMFLEGTGIFLRAYNEGDEQLVARIENHPDAREMLFYALPTSPKQQKDVLLDRVKDPHNVIFIICRKEDGEPIGQTALYRIDWVGRAAVFYIGIADKENWSRGYGSEATALIAEYAFQTLNLNRIQLHVAVENKRAVKVYQRTGFVIEGTLRQAMFRDGQYHDFYVMGLLKADWQRQ